MPQHKQFKKDIKRTEVRTLRNRIAMSQLRNAVKSIRTAATKTEAEAALKAAIPLIDSTARKGIIKKETAARKKSRLSKFVASFAS